MSTISIRPLTRMVASLAAGAEHVIRCVCAPVGAERIGWMGSALGVVGAAVLAANLSWSGLGWIAFLASNVMWLIYAVLERVRSILLMQMVFSITSLIGIYRWLA